MIALLSPHAVERFIKQWRPGLTVKEAERELHEAFARSSMKGPTLGGELWQTKDDVPIPFIVRRDPSVGLVVAAAGPSTAAAIELHEVEEVVAAYQRVTRAARGVPPLIPAVEERRVRGLAEHWISLETARHNAAIKEAAADLRGGRQKQLSKAERVIRIALTALGRAPRSHEIVEAVRLTHQMAPAYIGQAFLIPDRTTPELSDRAYEASNALRRMVDDDE